ncbi:hypothetical protein OC683_02270 ['Crotalaria aegyptiaca' phytoplasma]|uniref:Uncharacterized protein n=1 Tax=Candidatus Phytoplasma crotalariae TaxID=2982627 RepID=A0ABT9D654_9MOLU|nr:hypothetical protein ['Crotalaria aegyptiaca' phytoplasma]MDO8059418.1 hypothetical protein ['Crotalaria aegyptiaca' phytoplasma]
MISIIIEITFTKIAELKKSEPKILNDEYHSFLLPIAALKPPKSSLAKEIDKIKKLPKEVSTIVGDIAKISVHMGNVAANPNVLANCEDLNHARWKKEVPNAILSNLNSFYKIASAEG